MRSEADQSVNKDLMENDFLYGSGDGADLYKRREAREEPKRTSLYEDDYRIGQSSSHTSSRADLLPYRSSLSPENRRQKSERSQYSHARSSLEYQDQKASRRSLNGSPYRDYASDRSRTLDEEYRRSPIRMRPQSPYDDVFIERRKEESGYKRHRSSDYHPTESDSSYGKEHFLRYESLSDSRDHTVRQRSPDPRSYRDRSYERENRPRSPDRRAYRDQSHEREIRLRSPRRSTYIDQSDRERDFYSARGDASASSSYHHSRSSVRSPVTRSRWSSSPESPVKRSARNRSPMPRESDYSEKRVVNVYSSSKNKQTSYDPMSPTQSPNRDSLFSFEEHERRITLGTSSRKVEERDQSPDNTEVFDSLFERLQRYEKLYEGRGPEKSRLGKPHPIFQEDEDYEDNLPQEGDESRGRPRKYSYERESKSTAEKDYRKTHRSQSRDDFIHRREFHAELPDKRVESTREYRERSRSDERRSRKRSYSPSRSHRTRSRSRERLYESKSRHHRYTDRSGSRERGVDRYSRERHYSHHDRRSLSISSDSSDLTDTSFTISSSDESRNDKSPIRASRSKRSKSQWSSKERRRDSRSPRTKSSKSSNLNFPLERNNRYPPGGAPRLPMSHPDTRFPPPGMPPIPGGPPYRMPPRVPPPGFPPHGVPPHAGPPLPPGFIPPPRVMPPGALPPQTPPPSLQPPQGAQVSVTKPAVQITPPGVQPPGVPPPGVPPPGVHPPGVPPPGVSSPEVTPPAGPPPGVPSAVISPSTAAPPMYNQPPPPHMMHPGGPPPPNQVPPPGFPAGPPFPPGPPPPGHYPFTRPPFMGMPPRAMAMPHMGHPVSYGPPGMPPPPNMVSPQQKAETASHSDRKMAEQLKRRKGRPPSVLINLKKK